MDSGFLEAYKARRRAFTSELGEHMFHFQKEHRTGKERPDHEKQSAEEELACLTFMSEEVLDDTRTTIQSILAFQEKLTARGTSDDPALKVESMRLTIVTTIHEAQEMKFRLERKLETAERLSKLRESQRLQSSLSELELVYEGCLKMIETAEELSKLRGGQRLQSPLSELELVYEGYVDSLKMIEKALASAQTQD